MFLVSPFQLVLWLLALGSPLIAYRYPSAYPITALLPLVPVTVQVFTVSLTTPAFIVLGWLLSASAIIVALMTDPQTTNIALMLLLILTLLYLVMLRAHRISTTLRQLENEQPTLQRTVKEQGEALQRLLVDIETRARVQAALSDSSEQATQNFTTLTRATEALLPHRQLADAHVAFVRLMEEQFPTLSGAVHIAGQMQRNGIAPPPVLWGSGRDTLVRNVAACIACATGQSKRVCQDGPCMAGQSHHPLICIPLRTTDAPLGTLLLSPSGPLDEQTIARAELVGKQAALLFVALMRQAESAGATLFDAVTGLYSPDYLKESLKRELRRLSRSHRPLGLMVMEIDQFQRASSGMSDQERNACYSELASLCKRSIRGGDILARGLNDEIIVMMPDAPENIVAQRADKLRRTYAEQARPGSRAMQALTLSVGVVTFPNGGLTSDTLLHRAYALLRQAQQGGGNTVATHDARVREEPPPSRSGPFLAQQQVSV